MQQRAVDRLAAVCEQRVGLIAEQLLDVVESRLLGSRLLGRDGYRKHLLEVSVPRD
jgi:hypothetical protein